jgi:hypothetical protein
MSIINPGLAPQFYPDRADTTWTFDPQVERVAYSVNDIPPALSEYIAYDTLTPPNPFIAVTQDGKGNVVYDGGFPKFYNSTWTNFTSFSQLPGGYKYLWNAIHFCANAAKVAAGNKKVLFLGDNPITASYAVKSTGADGFNTSMQGLLALMGFTGVYKDLTDYPGGVLGCTFSELDAYCCVVMYSTAYAPNNPELITPAAITDLVTYREQGNGLIFITDHGTNVQTDIKQVTTPAGAGFYATANRVMVNFGSFFTGNFDRSPVNVGFLRRTYGDHPLYNGMLDSEDIYAGPSESKVVVTEYPTYTPGNIPAIPLATEGENQINFLVVMKDGTLVTGKYKYTIIKGEFLFHLNATGQQLGDKHTTFKRAWDGSLKTTIAQPPTFMGGVYRNGILLGNFQFNGVQTTYTWLTGSVRGFELRHGDVIEHRFTTPYNYGIKFTVDNANKVKGVLNHAYVIRQFARDEYASLTWQQAYAKVQAYAQAYFSDNANHPQQLPVAVHKDGPIVQSVMGVLSLVSLPVYDSVAELNAASNPDRKRAALVLPDQVWYYPSGNTAVRMEGANFLNFLEYGRWISSTNGKGFYHVGQAGNLVKH